VLKGDIMNVFHDFHTRDMFEKSLNASSISLFPKKLGPLRLRIFILLAWWVECKKLMPKL
jgi:hypothetical protein